MESNRFSMHLIMEYFSVIRLKRTTIDGDDIFAHVHEILRTRRISAVLFTFPIRLFQNSLRSRCARKQRVAIGIWVPTATVLLPPFTQTMTMDNIIRVSVLSPCDICIMYVLNILCVKYIGVNI